MFDYQFSNDFQSIVYLLRWNLKDTNQLGTRVTFLRHFSVNQINFDQFSPPLIVFFAEEVFFVTFSHKNNFCLRSKDATVRKKCYFIIISRIEYLGKVT